MVTAVVAAGGLPTHDVMQARPDQVQRILARPGIRLGKLGADGRFPGDVDDGSTHQISP